jgi:hypothetical protein
MRVKHALGARDVLNAKTRLVGRVCLVLLTDLIIRDGGKLLCQILKRFMLFGWRGLGGFWGFEGLDKGILLGFLRGGTAISAISYGQWDGAACGRQGFCGRKGWWVEVGASSPGSFDCAARKERELLRSG